MPRHEEDGGEASPISIHLVSTQPAKEQGNEEVDHNGITRTLFMSIDLCDNNASITCSAAIPTGV